MKNGVKVTIEIHRDVLEAITKLATISKQTPEQYLHGVVNLHAALGSPLTFITDADDASDAMKKLN